MSGSIAGHIMTILERANAKKSGRDMDEAELKEFEEMMVEKYTNEARMDHGGCALLVGVKDDQIVKVKGDLDGFLNKGYICPKGIASPDRLNHPDRLRHSLK